MQMYVMAKLPILYDVEAQLYVKEAQLDKFGQELDMTTAIANIVHANDQTIGVCDNMAKTKGQGRDLVEMHHELGELIHITPHNYAAFRLCRITLCGLCIAREFLQREIDNEIIRVDRDLNFNQVNIVQDDPLPQPEESPINMVEGCQGNYQVYNVRFVRGSLVRMHRSLFRLAFVLSHDYTACEVCSINPRACPFVRKDIQKLLDARTIIVAYPKNLENDVNVIIPLFNIPKPLEITFDSHNSMISPLVTSTKLP
ncbi:hypothetical protein KIW84_022111 [Lathyrus oleraceus]|uniref:Uncharacterized protein n=1 Tax=Pisum sativum TaxID=3888 RepID=A0A9D4Y9N4_PEA|nr:hypothetical protein KIW84_022111 [Pisum sativum]